MQGIQQNSSEESVVQVYIYTNIFATVVIFICLRYAKLSRGLLKDNICNIPCFKKALYKYMLFMYLWMVLAIVLFSVLVYMIQIFLWKQIYVSFYQILTALN